MPFVEVRGLDPLRAIVDTDASLPCYPRKKHLFRCFLFVKIKILRFNLGSSANKRFFVCALSGIKWKDTLETQIRGKDFSFCLSLASTPVYLFKLLSIIAQIGSFSKHFSVDNF